MKIWLLENGERTGPYEVYDIRDRISNGEVNAETSAWYDGAEGWVTLENVPAFSSYFKKPSLSESHNDEEKLSSDLIESLEKELARSESRPNSTVFQNEPLHPVRRLFARLLDIWLYIALLSIVKVQIGINPFAFDNLSRELLFQLPYLLLDGLALAYIGTTPGKWLLNIKLRANDGQMLDFISSLIRSVRVWVLGFAMQSPFVIVSLPIQWFIGSKYGKFLWDLPKNNITQCTPLSPKRIMGYFLIIIVMSYLLQYFIPPEYIPDKRDWKLWEQL